MSVSTVRAASFLGRCARRPTWEVAHVQNAVHGWLDGDVGAPAGAAEAVSVPEAVAALSGVDVAAAAGALQGAPRPRPSAASVLYGDPDGSAQLTSLLYALCRVLRPRTVVETGVAHGYSSAAILSALAENGEGRLISIDLPHLHPRAQTLVGAAVDARLRGRWQLHLGPAARLLPRVLGEAGPVDLVVHDASHTLHGQMAEYRRSWPHLRPDGVLVSDDVRPSFAQFAAAEGVRPIYVTQTPKLPIGALVKQP